MEKLGPALEKAGLGQPGQNLPLLENPSEGKGGVTAKLSTLVAVLSSAVMGCGEKDCDRYDRALATFELSGQLDDLDALCEAATANSTNIRAQSILYIRSSIYPKSPEDKEAAIAFLKAHPTEGKAAFSTIAHLRSESMVMLEYINSIAEFLQHWPDTGWRKNIIQKLVRSQDEVTVELERQQKSGDLDTATAIGRDWIEKSTVVIREVDHLVGKLGILAELDQYSVDRLRLVNDILKEVKD